MLDGGCPFYDVYRCRDGGYMAVGALEPPFFQELVSRFRLEKIFTLKNRLDRTKWPEMKEAFQQQFAQRTRREWEKVFDGTDACCTPVLEQEELQKAGYEQRLAVSLRNTPGLEIPQQDTWDGTGLTPGFGGEHILNTWFNWRRGKQYEIQNGGLVKINTAKL